MTASSSRLNAIIHKVVVYLKQNAADDYVVPRFAAKSIGEPEVSVITALRLLEERGVTRQRFGVFCGRTSVPIATFDDLKEIPSQIYCEICDEEHTQSDRSCKVEVFYTVNRKELDRVSTAEAAA